MAVGSGRYRHPDNSSYSEKVRKLIDFTLVVDPEKRPDIEQVRDARGSWRSGCCCASSSCTGLMKKVITMTEEALRS